MYCDLEIINSFLYKRKKSFKHRLCFLSPKFVRRFSEKFELDFTLNSVGRIKFLVHLFSTDMTTGLLRLGVTNE